MSDDQILSDESIGPGLNPPKRGKYGKKTKSGKTIGRPRKPLEERKLREKKELVIEKDKPRRHTIDDNDIVRRSIMGLAKMGKTIDDIADFVGVSKTWLRKHYIHEIKFGRQVADALVVENLYTQAMKDSPSSIQAGIYLTKARMGWTDKKEEVSNVPTVVFDFSEMDPEERTALMHKIKIRQGQPVEPQPEPDYIDGEIVEDEQN
jgi:hypothetical protein